MAKNLEKMSHKELAQLATEVESAMAAAKKRDKIEARKAAEAAAAQFGFTLADLIPASGKASKSAGAPKYANPDNPAQTWTGKGRQPQWYKAAIENGTDPSTLEV